MFHPDFSRVLFFENPILKGQTWEKHLEEAISWLKAPTKYFIATIEHVLEAKVPEFLPKNHGSVVLHTLRLHMCLTWPLNSYRLPPKAKPDRLSVPSIFRGKFAVKLRGCLT